MPPQVARAVALYVNDGRFHFLGCLAVRVFVRAQGHNTNPPRSGAFGFLKDRFWFLF